MRGTRKRSAWLVAVGLLAAACSGAGDVTLGSESAERDRQTSEPSETTATIDGAATVEPEPSSDLDPETPNEGVVTSTSDWVVYDLLRYVPATPESLAYIEVTDYERAAMRIGIDWPGPAAADEAAQWVRALAVDALAGSSMTGFEGGGEVLDIEGWRSEFGFSLADARAAVRTEHLAPTVVSVSVSPADIDAAVRSDPLWSGQLEDRKSADGAYYFWSDDHFQDHDRLSSARPLGRGGTMAVGGEIVIRATAVEPLETALELGAGGGGAGDDVAVRALVDALDRTGVQSFFLSNQVARIDPADPLATLPPTVTPEAIQEFREVADELPGHARHSMFAGGVGFDDGQAVDVIAFYHGDEVLAVENLERIRELIETGTSHLRGQQWSEIFRIRSIEQMGEVSVAALEPISGRPGAPRNAFFNRDSLFWIAAS